jgi:aminoglycoside/choline kinase family phosphotransferase
MRATPHDGSREDAWAELGATPGVRELPFPWPVAGAVRLGVHASQRRFYRLVPAACEKSLPPSLALVLYERDDAAAVARYERTARWFLAAGVRVPTVYGSSTRALIVEDGGDSLLADAPDNDELVSHYASAAHTILSLQAHGQQAGGPNPDWCLDQLRLRNELDFTEQHALRGWLDSAPSKVRDEGFDRLAAALDGQPQRMCHRDYHSRNLLVEDDLMVVDFQDAMAGPVFYDLVSLLRDDYRDIPTTAAARALEVFWSGAYTTIDALPLADVPQQPTLLPPGARQGFELTAAQRSLKALGTFGYQVSVAGRDEYAGYARRTWRHARLTLESLGWHDLVEALAVFDQL